MADEFVSPIDNPDLLAKAAAALQDSVDPAKPVPPPDCGVELAGGIQRGDYVISSAEVRELTGEHEEMLAKAVQAKPGNIFHFMNTMLECCVARFGTEDPSETRKLLKQALVGDRDTLMLAIRRATYGENIEVDGWECPSCGQTSDLVVPLEDIPVRELPAGVKDGLMEVQLTKGRTAEVRLATGADQLATFENPKLTMAERDTLLLSRVLVAIIDPDGTRHNTAGFAGSYARGMNAADRHEILKAINDAQPGPQLDELKIVHDACGNEVELLLGISDLFRGIRVV